MRFAAVTLAVIMFAAPAFAQTRTQPRPAAPVSEAEQFERLDRQAQLQELGRVVGGSHYLRLLCSTGADRYQWYELMRTLLDKEAPRTQPRLAGLRSQMAAAFNAGYRSEEVRFPACTAMVAGVEEELKRKGRRLTSALAATARPQ
jgi:uncharacterized protein (TIGR02301 family)